MFGNPGTHLFDKMNILISLFASPLFITREHGESKPIFKPLNCAAFTDQAQGNIIKGYNSSILFLSNIKCFVSSRVIFSCFERFLSLDRLYYKNKQIIMNGL